LGTWNQGMRVEIEKVRNCESLKVGRFEGMRERGREYIIEN